MTYNVFGGTLNPAQPNPARLRIGYTNVGWRFVREAEELTALPRN